MSGLAGNPARCEFGATWSAAGLMPVWCRLMSNPHLSAGPVHVPLVMTSSGTPVSGEINQTILALFASEPFRPCGASGQFGHLPSEKWSAPEHGASIAIVAIAPVAAPIIG